jgi:hypothetical protein
MFQKGWTMPNSRSYLSTYDLLTCLYPNHIPDNEYWSVLGVLHEHISFRSIAIVLEKLTPKSYYDIYHDASGFDVEVLSLLEKHDLEMVRSRLQNCGYNRWVETLDMPIED